ncbi:MAG: hypothetical protein R2707_07480 [Acidimicrobiales bacterium]
MIRTNIRTGLLFVAVLFVGACGDAPANEDAGPVFALDRSVADEIQPVDPDRTAVASAPVLRSLLQAQLTEHSDLSILAMRQAVDGTVEPSTVDALTANTDSLTLSLGLVYGPEGAAAFDQLWTNHIEFFNDYARAIGAGRTAEAERAVADLDHYESDFSSYADVVTSGNADFHAVVHVLHGHITQLLEQADAWATGDFERSYSLSADAHRHMDVIAGALATGIALQQPDAFPGAVDDPIAVRCAARQLDGSRLLAARLDLRTAELTPSPEATTAARAADAAEEAKVAPGLAVLVAESGTGLAAATDIAELPAQYRTARQDLFAALAAESECAGVLAG